MFTRLRVLLVSLYLLSFASVGLFATPAYAEVQGGLNWYTKIDVSDTPSLTPNFNTTDYFYCGISPDINYNWGGGTTQCLWDNAVAWGLGDPNQHDLFTNLWTGYITAPETGLVTFYSSNDDGFILKINGDTVISSWWEQGSWWYNGSGSYQMTAGESYTIEVLHHETGGGAVAQLFWQLPTSQQIEIIPTSAFTTEPIIQEPDPFLNSPTNLSILQRQDYVVLSWDAPADSGTSVERYAVSWNVEGGNGWGIASTETSIKIDKDVLRSTAPLNQIFTFTVRADNDSLSVYSPESQPLGEYINEVPTYECWDGSIVDDESQCPPPPPPPPTYECWDGSIVSDLSQCPPVPPTVECWDGTMVYDQSECPAEPPLPPSIECWDGSFVYDINDCPVKPVDPVDPVDPPTPPVDPVDPPVDPVDPPTPPDTSNDDASNVAEDAAADGVITEEEKAEIVDALLEEYSSDEAIPAGMLEELGLDYEDLPPDQPVTLENGVVLTAEVADAIEIFENPSELLSTVFTDPSKALTAIANIGADLPAAVRDKAQKVAVASVIVTQVIAGTASLLTRRI